MYQDKYSLEDIIVFFNLIVIMLVFYFHESIFSSISFSDSVLGTILQVLASTFAIVFSISLVAIQMYSENLSHRLIDVYINNFHVLLPSAINFMAIIIDFIILVNYSDQYYFVGLGISFLAIISLVPFFIFSIKFLKPTHITRLLLERIHRLNDDGETLNLVDYYDEYFQPIEDMSTKCIVNNDYATTKDILILIFKTMINVNEKNIINNELFDEESIRKNTMPFIKILKEIASTANKSDAIKITEFIIVDIITNYLNAFITDARFMTIFMIFDEMLEDVSRQAGYRFDSPEFSEELILIETTIADLRTNFSDHMV